MEYCVYIISLNPLNSPVDLSVCAFILEISCVVTFTTINCQQVAGLGLRLSASFQNHVAL